MVNIVLNFAVIINFIVFLVIPGKYFTGFKVSFELLLLSRVKSILLLERIISFVYHMFRCLT